MKTILTKNDVFEVIVESINKTISREISDYNSPLIPIIKEVVEEKAEEIRAIAREALGLVVSDKEFKNNIKLEFQRKVAKNMVAKLEGSVEKAVEVLRQSPALKSEMILAIEKIINDNK